LHSNLEQDLLVSYHAALDDAAITALVASARTLVAWLVVPETKFKVEDLAYVHLIDIEPQ